MALRDLSALELAMGELLSVMRGKQSSPLELAASWERCRSIGGGLEAVLERLQTGGPLDLASREAVDRLVRLNAICRQTVVEEQALLARNLARTRESGKQVRGYLPTAPSSPSAGRRCDLAG